MNVRDIIAIGILLGFLFAAAHIGAAKGERAHRALDQRYQMCERKFHFGTPAFRECLR